MSSEQYEEEDWGRDSGEEERDEEEPDVRRVKLELLAEKDEPAATDEGGANGESAFASSTGEDGESNEGKAVDDQQFEDADAVARVSVESVGTRNATQLGSKGANSVGLGATTYYQQQGADTPAASSWQGAGASTFEMPAQYSIPMQQTLLSPPHRGGGPTPPAGPTWRSHAPQFAATSYPNQYPGAAPVPNPPAGVEAAALVYAAVAPPVLSAANASSEHYEWWSKYYQHYYRIMEHKMISGVPPPPPPNPWRLPNLSSAAAIRNDNNLASHRPPAAVPVVPPQPPVDLVLPPPYKRQRVGNDVANGEIRARVGHSAATEDTGDPAVSIAAAQKDEAVSSLTKMYQC